MRNHAQISMISARQQLLVVRRLSYQEVPEDESIRKDEK